MKYIAISLKRDLYTYQLFRAFHASQGSTSTEGDALTRYRQGSTSTGD